jgi:HPr kinase/phosphorylase
MASDHRVADLYQLMQQRCHLDWLAGKNGGEQIISQSEARAHGDSLLSYLNLIHPSQIQILGERERRYLDHLKADNRESLLNQLFSPPTRMVMVADQLPPAAEWLELADRTGIALFGCNLNSFEVVLELQHLLNEAFADQIVVHGVFLEVLGKGVLLTGDAGIGKSELALELISRGHRLIADDAVTFAKVSPRILSGSCPPLLQDFLEVRGLGILNLRALFGHNVMKPNKNLYLIIKLKTDHENESVEQQRLFGQHREVNLLGVKIPETTITIDPGRNLAVLVETAVRNQLLLASGYNSAHDFQQRLHQSLNPES